MAEAQQGPPTTSLKTLESFSPKEAQAFQSVTKDVDMHRQHAEDTLWLDEHSQAQNNITNPSEASLEEENESIMQSDSELDLPKSWDSSDSGSD